jgi:hypothetical protein
MRLIGAFLDFSSVCPLVNMPWRPSVRRHRLTRIAALAGNSGTFRQEKVVNIAASSAEEPWCLHATNKEGRKPGRKIGIARAGGIEEKEFRLGEYGRGPASIGFAAQFVRRRGRVGSLGPMLLGAHSLLIELPCEFVRSARQVPHDDASGRSWVIDPWADRWLNCLGTGARKKTEVIAV